MRKINVLLIGCFVSMLSPIARAQGVNNAELQGNYAFSFTGMTSGNGIDSTPFAAVGRFTADGAGNLANGELDSNGLGVSLGGVEKAVALAFTGTYSIGADNRGVMNLNIPGGGTLAFAMMANGNAKFVEVDASGNHGTVGSGTMEKVDAAAYNTSRITGDYAFGVSGFDQSNNRTALAGRFTSNGMGLLTNGDADENLSGTFTTMNLFAGTYAVTDGATGRGALNLAPVIGGSLQNLNFVFYVVNGGKIFMMESDVISTATPLLLGSVLQQQTPALAGFTNASLSGGMVMYGSGGAGAPSGPGPEGGLLTADGTGMLQVDFNGVCWAETGTNSGTYTVASNGRTVIRAGGGYAAAYLVNSNEAFWILPDSCVSFGFAEPQAPGTVTNSAIAGNYAGSTAIPTSVRDAIFSGEFTADGASPSGSISGVEDIGYIFGPRFAVAANATYAVSGTPVNGKGSWYVNGFLAGIVYVISPSKFVVLILSDPSPLTPNNHSLLIFEK